MEGEERRKKMYEWQKEMVEDLLKHSKKPYDQNHMMAMQIAESMDCLGAVMESVKEEA